MKLEVGMYVRTKKGYIYKLIRYEEDNNRWISSEENDWYPVYESLVTKASYNIIDLIEVGDYVNGHEVKSKQSGVKRIDIGEDENYVWLYEENIKSVVTHEQMEQMAYKVGE